ncbi:glycosyltransferase [Venenivibrio stagnispumantis]|uniref:Glycosyl transferases group 1 n=1 Tax=Venenivibrio stagnispumantis TaxID=407998 RepID=A0AA45WN54_9AQUI|nr:glycosyltransferase [Venenivibrio stagnispumantis]MCW4573206.1 glycosyltransferase [Venenivibrio stagnispumantis]SMP17390.1 Glycosyl transferases group 1 [Venenivibrio stagnispumantis]
MKTIVLFTNSYPYSQFGEYPFVEPELKILSKYFKIIIFPLGKETEKKRNLVSQLNNVFLYDNDFKFNKYKELFFNAIKVDKFFFQELTNIKNKNHLKSLIAYHTKSKWIEKIIESKLKSGEWNREYLYYTYWFDFATTALLNLKEKFNLKVITRVHRYDLYEEVRRNGYIPFRKTDIKKIDKVFTVSMQGFNYLKNKYKTENIINSYLGIEDRNVENPLNTSNAIKIVSCSLMVPVKRINLIIEYLSKYSKEFNIKIEWHHIGSGILEENLKLLSEKLKHRLFEIHFVGYLENNEIFNYYKNNPFDYFITLTKSEGGVPVSLMEACSVGLPIIATNVGGIGEIVENEKNGFLLSSNPSYEEFKEVFKKAILLKSNIEEYIKFRKNSRDIFLEKFSADRNYEKFAKYLEEILSNKDFKGSNQ